MAEQVGYEDLNSAVNIAFLDGRYQRLPVFLDLDDEVRNEIGTWLGVGSENIEKMIGEVIAGSLLWERQNIYSRHNDQLKKWQRDNWNDPPPFTALLLCLSIAAERMRSDPDFSSLNYYNRLCQVLHVTGEERRQALSHNGKNTDIFWQSLNLWLTKNDYAFGMPTASQISRKVHISYAISQSLVRDAERKQFHDMFARFRLSRADYISQGDMKLYLAEWMASSNPSEYLKRLWSSPETKERVIAAAIDELSTWEDVEVMSGAEVKRRLAWVTAINVFPRKRLSLHLATPARQDDQGKHLRLQGTANAILTRGLGSTNPSLWLDHLPGIDMLQVGPRASLDVSALLHVPFVLLSNDSQASFVHDPRPFIPMARLEGHGYYREVSRPNLFTDNIILCHESWKVRVRNFLGKHAKLGFTELGPEDLPGVPLEWVLFRGVVLVDVPSGELSNDLQGLVPLTEGAGINLIGGLKLAQGIWHAAAPPEVYASGPDGLLAVELETFGFGAKVEVVAQTSPASYDAGFLHGRDLTLESQDLVIVAKKGPAVAAKKQISFRSGLTPRQFNPGRDIRLAYLLAEDLGSWLSGSAVEVKELSPHVPRLQGMLITGEVPQPSGIGGALESCEVSPLEHEQEENGTPISNESVKTSESCILRGYHHWICEPHPAHRGTCKHCNLVSVFPKPKKGAKGKKPENISQVGHSATHVDTHALVDHPVPRPSPDTILDALCYLGTGSRNSLETIAYSCSEDPMGGLDLIHNLISLGHLDASLDGHSGRITGWSLAPSTLVFAPSGTAYLAGFRNRHVVDLVASLLGEPIHEEQEHAPASIRWNRPRIGSGDVARLLAEHATQPATTVRATNAPAMDLAQALPSFGQLMSGASEITVDRAVHVERFDVGTGKWKLGPLEGKGTYRVDSGGRHYFVYDGVGNAREVNFEVAKIFAARMAGLRLHGYDPSRQEFHCILGCDPPGLYKRALTSCSGLIGRREGMKITYVDVPPDVGNLVMKKLYG